MCSSMDGKDSQREELLGAGDSIYLQRELGRVLPAALATVVQLQPSDPITVLALWLYKYRELNPLPDTAISSSDVDDMSHGETPVTIRRPTNMLEGSTVPRPAHCVTIVQDSDNDDFIEDSGYGLNPDLQGSLGLDSAVHNDIIPMFSSIGDLCDDDDLEC